MNVLLNSILGESTARSYIRGFAIIATRGSADHGSVIAIRNKDVLLALQSQCILTGRQGVGNGHIDGTRQDQVGSQVCKRLQYKPARRHPRVRYREDRCPDSITSEKENVNVERPRGPLAIVAYPTGSELDLVAQYEQRMRREVSGKCDHGVEIRRLRLPFRRKGLRLIDRRTHDDMVAAGIVQRAYRSAKVLFAVAEV